MAKRVVSFIQIFVANPPEPSSEIKRSTTL
jgi:hypothetical protein